MSSNDTLTRVQGILVGHDTLQQARTGCTVVLAPAGAVAAVDVRGAAPGTRETDLLRPENLVSEVHAVLLAGGSAFGLAAATGVVDWLYEHHIGFETGFGRVPIVPAAVLFDLNNGRADVWPDQASGYRACQSAGPEPVVQGRVGAGTGATVAKVRGWHNARPGGVGSFAADLPGGGTVAALVAVNALGEIVDPATGRIVVSAGNAPDESAPPWPGQNTTLGVVATDLKLTKAQCLRVAQMAHDGLARTIRPSHTLYDGDTIFVLATGAGPPGEPNSIGILAAEVVAQAILRACRQTPSA
ncbi:MAG: peptidase S58 family protein [Caldilineae bacterium]|nr:MAG: peptidase S58 family protein [Caldilineae bacterium]